LSASCHLFPLPSPPSQDLRQLQQLVDKKDTTEFELVFPQKTLALKAKTKEDKQMWFAFLTVFDGLYDEFKVCLYFAGHVSTFHASSPSFPPLTEI
jgi:hypothetical protein